jgi:hypothetical protein
MGEPHYAFQSLKRSGLAFKNDDIAPLNTVVSEPSQQRVLNGVAMLNRRFILGENRSTAALTRCWSVGIPRVDRELIDSLTDTAGDEQTRALKRGFHGTARDLPRERLRRTRQENQTGEQDG